MSLRKNITEHLAALQAGTRITTRQIKHRCAEGYAPSNVHRAIMRLVSDGWLKPGAERAEWIVTGEQPATSCSPSEYIDSIVIDLNEGTEFDVRLFDAHGVDRTKHNATARCGELLRRGYVERIGRQGARTIWRRTARRSERDIPIPKELAGWARIWPGLFRLPDIDGKLRTHNCMGG